MNRTDRLLAIVLELQRKKTCRAEDLAKKFETCKRTIYRDIQALSQSGVPVVSMPGQGYSLMEDYFLPPLHLNPEEAVTLLLGADYVEQNFDASFRVHARGSKAKIEAILPQKQRVAVHELRGTLRLMSGSFFHNVVGQDPIDQQLFLLRQAISEQNIVSFVYRKKIRRKQKRGKDRFTHTD